MHQTNLLVLIIILKDFYIVWIYERAILICNAYWIFQTENKIPSVYETDQLEHRV